jgi:hypothetical protein
MQGRLPPTRPNLLATHAGPYIWVKLRRAQPEQNRSVNLLQTDPRPPHPITSRSANRHALVMSASPLLSDFGDATEDFSEAANPGLMQRSR